MVFGLADGGFVRQWGVVGEGEGQFKYPGFVVVKGGEVLVTYSNNHRVQVFVRQWGGGGDGEGLFKHPTGLAVSEGEVYVCNSGNYRVRCSAEPCVPLCLLSLLKKAFQA